jgi:hypothetical protein
MKTLTIAAAGLVMLAGCSDGVQYFTLNSAAIQTKIEAMTGLPPAQQCAIYFEAKKYASAELVAKATAIIEEQSFICAPAPVA